MTVLNIVKPDLNTRQECIHDLLNGTWFLDRDGDLCVKTDSGMTCFTDNAVLSYADNHDRCCERPLKLLDEVTISA
jgi:hypothetical protein